MPMSNIRGQNLRPFMPSAKPPYIVESDIFPLSHFLTDFVYFVPRKDRVEKEWASNDIQLISWQQSYLMSVFYQQYVPRLVLREKRGDLGAEMEVLDGWLRINAIRRFLQCRIQLPIEIRQLFPDAFGAYVEDGSTRYDKLNRDLNFSAFVNTAPVVYIDIVKGIDNPRIPKHEEMANWLFGSLQARR
jgi:hypothetical protein